MRRRNFLATAAMASLADAQTHFAPKAKRVIYLFQSGAPSQIEQIGRAHV